MNQSLVPTTTQDVQTIATSLAKSGFFRDAEDASKAFVKVLAGAELGLPAFQSMSGIHIVQGKPQLSSGIMAALIKRSGRYNYRVLEHTAEVCRIEFYENGQVAGVSEMTMKDAKAASLNMEWNKAKNAFTEKATWKNFPKNMLFNRAMSNGAKWYTPDIFGGPVYAEGELEDLPQVVDGNAEVVHEAKPTAAKTTGKKATALAAKQYQETGTLPAGTPTAEFTDEPAPAVDPAKIQSRIEEYVSNIENAQDDPSFDWNEETLAADGLLPNNEKRALIKQSISKRINSVDSPESANHLRGRIVKYLSGLGDDATVLFADLKDQAEANGVLYHNGEGKNKYFYRPEPTNEELSQALADNG